MMCGGSTAFGSRMGGFSCSVGAGAALLAATLRLLAATLRLLAATLLLAPPPLAADRIEVARLLRALLRADTAEGAGAGRLGDS